MIQCRHSAFSLIELSIVLVILGLLTGAILAGQSLIRASEIRSVGVGFNRYETAIYAFKDKYFALPGDISNATAIWGKDATNCNGNSGTATIPGTCNGDGDGNVTQASVEMWRAWQHLSLAGLVEGSYAGTQVNWGANAKPSTDMPAGRIPNTGYMLLMENNTNAEFAWTDITFNKNMLVFGTAGSSWTKNAAITSIEAWNIDTKLDDGAPGTGKIWGGIPAGGCVTGTVSTSAQYTLTGSNSTGIKCIMAKLL